MRFAYAVIGFMKNLILKTKKMYSEILLYSIIKAERSKGELYMDI